jgi:hypothetical protein
MSLEQTVDNLEIRYANAVTFVGTSNTMIDTTTGRIQTKGIQHNSNVITDVSGPHGRVAPSLKKYPEIVFEEGKFDRNDTTNTYTQAGYTVSASTTYSTHRAFKAFNGVPNDFFHWQVASFSNSDGTYSGGTQSFESIPGEWLKIEVPNKIKPASINLYRRDFDGQSPKDFKIYASITGSSWTLLTEQTGIDNWTNAAKSYNFDTGIYYKYFAILVTKITRTNSAGAQTSGTLGELEIYGYEEYTPAGDHSVDTTFMSRFNNPQTTGAQVLVDGATGVGTNQISGGPDPSGNQSTYVTDGKYWTLNGTLTSNLAVEANTFLEGDQPHAVSVWFNSSNLEANVSNTCVFSVSDQEKLDSVNLDLQSNTWHNLTYAYQGEGGSRVTYLDGRKVAEDQAEDTFGDYPPFAMTGYSQGGYVLSVDADHDGTNKIWKAFDGDDSPSSVWFSQPGSGDADSSYQAGYARGNAGQSVTDTDGTTHSGSWGKIEFPYKFVLNYVRVHGGTPISSYWPHNPDNYVILGSNDDTNWDLLTTRTGANDGSNGMTAGGTNVDQHPVNATKAYKYIKFLVTKLGSTSGDREFIIASLKLYGHRENDLVRLPDPTNVLKYPHIAMTGPAQRGYVVTGSTYSHFPASGDPDALWRSFDGITGDNAKVWKTYEMYTTAGVYSPGSYSRTASSITDTNSTQHSGEYLVLETPHKIKLSSWEVRAEYAPRRIVDYAILGSDTNSSSANKTGWTLLTSGTFAAQTDVTATVSSPTTAFKYHAIVVKSVTNNGDSRRSQVHEMKLYGTGVDSIPIQIGGGNIDKVANFRVYDKFIDQNQALEIWDAQKDEFGRAKSSMTLQKGRLGIGTDGT